MEPWYGPLLTQDFLTPHVGGDVWLRGAIGFILGACVGSFLNVVALRSLLHRSWLRPASACMHCEKRLMPWDMIPIISYFLLGGRCRSCKKSIHWQYPLVEAVTGALFVAIFFKFGFSFDGIAMCIFAATLITVTITDFREHLIPHEITYPSIILGLIYFGIRHGNPAGALIGAGVSYILFDFIDFYGLVAISHLKEEEKDIAPGATPWVEDESMNLKEKEYNPDDDIVMGGGDAVLSAVIACWLGWQSMSMAVIIAFLVGSLMGAIYLLRDMQQRDVLSEAAKPALVGFIIGFSILAVPLVSIGFFTQNQDQFFTPQLGLLATFGGLAGALLGAVMSGSRRFANRFPFGPSLAFGGLVALLVAHEAWYFSEPLGIIKQGGGF